MFDMGFTEMMLIGVVALVVIGPEKLPGVARTAGKYFARLRNFMTNVRADVESELKADELREMFEAQQQELQSLKEVVGDVGKDIGLSEISSEISDIASSAEDTTPTPAVDEKKAVKATAKSKVKTKAKPKAATKPKPKAVTKLKPKAKASPKAKAAVKAKVPGDRSKLAKSAKVKAK